MSAKARPVARAAGAALLLVAIGVIVGCGHASTPRPARLDITAPSDGAVVREDTVQVRGLVRPSWARVLVGGRAATVSAGEFSASVPLHEGSNLIDVGASARGAASAWAAVRVARRTLVRVPDVAGATRDDAVNRLRDLGLRPEVHEDSGLLEKLLPADPAVCEVRPEPGTEVSSGARVRLLISKTC
jgi:glucodextranase-like protein/PASTA domain-containing protein